MKTPPDPEPPLHGDMSLRVAVETAQMAWKPSPSGTVWRKRLHRVGALEGGQVTSLVRFEPGAAFPAHDHPGGEEILVLEGLFADDRGTWPAGSYLLNPEGYRHAPSSPDGCILFVKLRQYGGKGRVQAAVNTRTAAWRPGPAPAGEVLPLYEDEAFPDSTRLERYASKTANVQRTFDAGAEFFVLEGSFQDGDGTYPAGAWLRLPPGTIHCLASPGGCTLYVKTGGVAELLSE